VTDDLIAFQPLALYGKLRRATEMQVRNCLKGRIDQLLAKLDEEQVLPDRKLAALSRRGILHNRQS
jgi:hypothetical protein